MAFFAIMFYLVSSSQLWFCFFNLSCRQLNFTFLLQLIYLLFNNEFRYPLKAVKVMHTVALRTESSLPFNTTAPTHNVYKVCIERGGGLLILVLFLLHIQVVWTNRIRFYVNCTSELWRLMSNLATAATVQVTGSNFQLSSCFHCLNTLWIHFFFGRAIWVKCLLSMPQLWLTLSIHLSLSSQEQGPWLYF